MSGAIEPPIQGVTAARAWRWLWFGQVYPHSNIHLHSLHRYNFMIPEVLESEDWTHGIWRSVLWNLPNYMASNLHAHCRLHIISHMKNTCGTCSMNTNHGQWKCTILMGISQGKTRLERTSADEGGRGRGSWYELLGPSSPEGGPGSRVYCIYFCLSR